MNRFLVFCFALAVTCFLPSDGNAQIYASVSAVVQEYENITPVSGIADTLTGAAEVGFGITETMAVGVMVQKMDSGDVLTYFKGTFTLPTNRRLGPYVSFGFGGNLGDFNRENIGLLGGLGLTAPIYSRLDAFAEIRAVFYPNSDVERTVGVAVGVGFSL